MKAVQKNVRIIRTAWGEYAIYKTVEGRAIVYKTLDRGCAYSGLWDDYDTAIKFCKAEQRKGRRERRANDSGNYI